jgi:hypothetical protein
MLKNNGQEIKESGKMLALTMVLTNFLLLLVAGGLVWLVQAVLTRNSGLSEITRGFNLF